MKRIVYLGICICFYILYFKILSFIWEYMPWNNTTDIIAVFILVFVNIPLSLISTEKVIAIIKKDI